eukprot:scaffold22432_cov168-Amphora_coffeaeformis.AAC.19
MSPPAVEESAIKRTGSIGNRVKNLLRSPSQKSNDHQLLQYRVRVRSDPKLVQVTDDDTVRVSTPVEALLAEPPMDDESRDNSLCPTDEGTEPLLGEDSLAVFHTSNVSSIKKPTQAAATVPANTSPRKGGQEAQEDTRSAGTESTQSSSDPADRDSPSSYRNDGDDSQTDESVSLLTFDTLRSATRTITPTNELSYEGVVGVIGNMVDKQWRAFEKSIICEQEDTHLDRINEEGDEGVVTKDGLEYAPSDHEHLRTSGHSMDNKVFSDMTTPSAGTRVISNSPKKQKKNDGYTANLLSDDEESLVDTIEEEDQLVHFPHDDMRRACSEIIQRTNPAMEAARTRSTGESSILNILKDLSFNEEEFSYMRSIVSVPSNSTRVNDTASLPTKGCASPKAGCWDMFDFGMCEPDKLCAVDEVQDEEHEPAETESCISDEVSLEKKNVPAARTTMVEPVATPAKDNHKSIPQSLPRKPTIPGPIEESSEPSLEQTVESHEQIMEALRKYNSARGWDSTNSKEKNGFFKKFRSDFPDYSGSIKDATKASAKTAGPEASTRNLSPPKLRVLKTAEPDGKEHKKGHPAESADSKKTDTAAGTDSKETQPVFIKKKRSFFGILSSSPKARQGEENQTQFSPDQTVGGKANAKQEKSATKMSNFLQIRGKKKVPSAPDRSNSSGFTETSMPLRRGRSMPTALTPLRRNRSAPSAIVNETPQPIRNVTKQANKTEKQSAKAGVVSKKGDEKALCASTNIKSKISASKPSTADVKKNVEKRPLRKNSKTSSSVSRKSPVQQSQRKVAFSRTPLIMQRFQMSRAASAKKLKDSHDEGISLLDEKNNNGVSLKTGSWSEEICDYKYVAPRSATPVLMTSHSIPKQSTCPSPVQHLYASGNKEFEEFLW